MTNQAAPPGSVASFPALTAALGPLLGDPAAARDAAVALRRYSLVTPGRRQGNAVASPGSGCHLAQVPAEAVGHLGAGAGLPLSPRG